MTSQKIYKEGIVTKQGGAIKTWKKRLCVLDDTGLLYYKVNQNDKYLNLQGHIELASIETCSPVTSNHGKHKFCFQVVTPGRNFIISAQSAIDMAEWVDVITRVVGGKKKTAEEKKVDPAKIEEKKKQLTIQMNDEIAAKIEEHTQEAMYIIDELASREIDAVTEKYDADIEAMKVELLKRGELD